MSSQKKSSRLEGKDLITIGIYTVIYVVIVMLVAMLGFIPIFIPLMAVLCPLIGGIPYGRRDPEKGGLQKCKEYSSFLRRVQHLGVWQLCSHFPEP